MKTKSRITLLTLCGLLGLVAGCSKQENVPPQAVRAPAPADTSAADAEKAAQVAAQQQAEAAKTAEIAKSEAAKKQAETDKLATDTAAAEKASIDRAAAEKAAADKLAQEAAASGEQARIAGMIDSARNLIGQNKYADALKMLSDLSSSKLTSAQATVVDGLKKTAEKQAEQALIDKAASQAPAGVGDILGGKK